MPKITATGIARISLRGKKGICVTEVPQLVSVAEPFWGLGAKLKLIRVVTTEMQSVINLFP